MDLDRTAILAIIAEQSRNHAKAAELWKAAGFARWEDYHTGAVHVCGEIRDRIERIQPALLSSGRGEV